MELILYLYTIYSFVREGRRNLSLVLFSLLVPTKSGLFVTPIKSEDKVSRQSHPIFKCVKQPSLSQSLDPIQVLLVRSKVFSLDIDIFKIENM